jgi:hypothetical protein
LDIDALLKQKVSQASNSRVGKFLFFLSKKVGGVRRLALLNMLCTASLGFAISFPIYSVGGMAAAFPTAFFTLLLISFIFAGIVSPRFRPLRKISPKLLVFAIIFSLPFGLLSLPLLQRISSKA